MLMPLLPRKGCSGTTAKASSQLQLPSPGFGWEAVAVVNSNRANNNYQKQRLGTSHTLKMLLKFSHDDTSKP